jgi:uncharacterized membrane protein
MDDQEPEIIDAGAPQRRFRRFGLISLIVLLIAAAVVLISQLFPGAWGRFLNALDVRNWSWQGRLWANVGLLVVLILIRYESAIGDFVRRFARQKQDRGNPSE